MLAAGPVRRGLRSPVARVRRARSGGGEGARAGRRGARACRSRGADRRSGDRPRDARARRGRAARARGSDRDAADELRVLLIPRDAADDRSAILEVRAGTGGDEAALFAGDLFRMYERYAALHGWKIEVLSASDGEVGGYREIVATVRGVGRLCAAEIRIGRAPRAARADDGGERPHPYLGGDRRGAAGGGGRRYRDQVGGPQHRHDARVELRRPARQHHRDRRSASCTSRPGSSSPQREIAAPEPRAAPCRCCARASTTWSGRSRRTARAAERKGQVGSGDRSERIRTYNFPQGRVTDHRINLTLYKLDKVLDGEALDEVVDALIADDQAQKALRVRGQRRVTTYRRRRSPKGAPRSRRAASRTPALDARLLLAAAAGLDTAALIARSGDALPELADSRLQRPSEAPAARRAGRAHPRRDRILGPAVQAQRRDAGAAPRDRNAGRGRARRKRAAACRRTSRSATLAPAPARSSSRFCRSCRRRVRVATDISEEALAMARRNAERHRRAAALTLRRRELRRRARMGRSISSCRTRPISEARRSRRLQREVREHDPRVALDGGPDGLAAYRAILARAGTLLAAGRVSCA